jgi:hypothetical protein
MLPVEIVVWANKLIEASRTHAPSVKNQELSVEHKFRIIVASSSIAGVPSSLEPIQMKSWKKESQGTAEFYKACRTPESKTAFQEGRMFVD